MYGDAVPFSGIFTSKPPIEEDYRLKDGYITFEINSGEFDDNIRKLAAKQCEIEREQTKNRILSLQEAGDLLMSNTSAAHAEFWRDARILRQQVSPKHKEVLAHAKQYLQYLTDQGLIDDLADIEVTCDESNNTAASIARGELNVTFTSKKSNLIEQLHQEIQQLKGLDAETVDIEAASDRAMMSTLRSGEPLPYNIVCDQQVNDMIYLKPISLNEPTMKSELVNLWDDSCKEAIAEWIDRNKVAYPKQHGDLKIVDDTPCDSPQAADAWKFDSKHSMHISNNGQVAGNVLSDGNLNSSEAKAVGQVYVANGTATIWVNTNGVVVEQTAAEPNKKKVDFLDITKQIVGGQ